MVGLLLFPSSGVVAFISLSKSSRVQFPISSRLFAITDIETRTEQECDVAIFGGGFGGLYTALAISREAKLRRKKLDIRLVDSTDEFVFLPLLYDLTVGTATEAEVCPRYNDLLQGTGVQHLKASLDSLGTSEATLLPPSTNNHKNNRDHHHQTPSNTLLKFKTAVISLGASPEAVLKAVPGAKDHAQPFYTREDAQNMRRLLSRTRPTAQIVVVGGGYGGVELAACVQRRLPQAEVVLVSRGPPMAGTRAEPLVDRALKKLGVRVEDASVERIEESEQKGMFRCIRRRQGEGGGGGSEIDDDSLWDAILWTAGSQPADPVPNNIHGLQISASKRIAIDQTLRCYYEGDTSTKNADRPMIWALGDCSEIISTNQPAVPRTAQAAMQQAEIVASNLLSQLEKDSSYSKEKEFVFQDLGSMLMLGGPNAALMAPKQDTALAPLFGPILDTVEKTLGVADDILAELPITKEISGVAGLSLGSHGLGVESGAAPGTLAGTITGAARRAIYAARMPTNQQRAVSVVSAALSTAIALTKEASGRSKKYD
eukprot:CAMPEP_0202464250 /NCGR_PEP_ID=MMETSP1360-20130828/61360_1 /ASSEMBLY_ACC=CAM_ASM_000848 /TAXON_ID=515479 /ORGANISM="Licmophora paradoxa, Strain CCMP2313" /LENGTH=542 /DNA_ID=CAMNT_0049087495 /DNA_START=18 /DNA_END=1646 /DNA_ORIENTATION=-